MKFKSFVLAAVFGSCLTSLSFGQSVDDILQNGQKLNDQSIILLQVDAEGKIQYEIWPRQKNKYRPLSESSLFLSTLDYAHVYMRPVNPLNQSQKNELKFTVDSAEKKAADALGLIVTTIMTNLKSGDFQGTRKVIEKDTKTGKDKIITETITCNEFGDLLKQLAAIRKNLSEDKKNEMAELFGELKGISFTNESEAIKKLDEVKPKLEEIGSYYEDQQRAINSFKESVDTMSCGTERDVFINKFVFNELHSKLVTVYTAQHARFKNLQDAYKLVKAAQVEGSGENEDGLKWVVKFKPIEIKKGEISEFTVTTHESGLTLSAEKEIVKVELKEKQASTLKFRRFRRFLPEVLAGVAFTQLHFPNFSTEKNANGEEVVVEAGSENVRRLNFTTMVNFNYYAGHSNLHPFFQVGIGANVGYPSLLAGGGVRIKLNGIPAFCLSVGAASSWVKELKTLKTGQVVNGLADVENDITYAFKSPKFYYGIQIQL